MTETTDTGKILHPSAGLRLGPALIWLWGAEGITKILAFITFGYLGRVLGLATYGDLEFAIGLWFVLNLVMESGLTDFGVREAARAPHDAGRLRAEILVVRSVLFFVGGAAIWSLAFLPLDVPHHLARFYLLALLPVPWFSTWLFQALGEVQITALSSLVRQAGASVLIVCFVSHPEDVWLVPIAEAAGLGLVVICHQVLLRRRQIKLRWTGLREKLQADLPRVLPMSLSAITWAIRLFAPLLILREVAGSESAAIFAGGHRLILAAHTFVWLYYFALFPRWSEFALRGPVPLTQGLLASRSLISGVIPPLAWIGTALADPLPAWIFGTEFRAAGGVLAVQTWMLATAFVSGHARYGLFALGRPRLEFTASALGAGTAILLTLVLVPGAETPVDAAWRAACVFVVAELVTFRVAHVFLRRSLPNLPTNLRGDLVLFAGFLASLSLRWCDGNTAPGWAGFICRMAFVLIGCTFLRSTLRNRQKLRSSP